MSLRTIGQNRMASPRSIVIGPGDGADYKISTSDNASVKFLAAINAAMSNNIRDIEIRDGTYNFTTQLTVPKDPYVRFFGAGANRTILKATAAMTALIYFPGNANATANSDLTHGLDMYGLNVSAQGLADYAFWGFNSSVNKFVDCGFSSGALRTLNFTYVGTDPPTSATVPGGIWMDRCTFGGGSGTTGMYMEYQTQCWITNSWCEGSSMLKGMEIKSCNKIKIEANEFNDCTTEIVMTDTATVACANNIIKGNSHNDFTPVTTTFVNSDSHNLISAERSTFTRTGAGAIYPFSPINLLVTTGANALTLADAYEGCRVKIIMITDGGDGTLTPTSKSGYNTITFNDVGDTAELEFINGAWVIIGYYGVTIA